MLEVVAALIYNADGQFLICQRPAHKARALQWEFPGGKIEKGETPEDALMRECCEGEYTDLVYAYPDLTVHLHLIRCRIAEGEPKRIEHADMRWIELSQAGDFDFCPADRIFIDRLR